MRRCHFCKGILWPWQRVGWMSRRKGFPVWHISCAKIFQREMEREQREYAMQIAERNWREEHGL